MLLLRVLSTWLLSLVSEPHNELKTQDYRGRLKALATKFLPVNPKSVCEKQVHSHHLVLHIRLTFLLASWPLWTQRTALWTRLFWPEAALCRSDWQPGLYQAASCPGECSWQETHQHTFPVEGPQHIPILVSNASINSWQHKKSLDTWLHVCIHNIHVCTPIIYTVQRI